MAEYLIKFKATVDVGIFPKQMEGSEIYEGSTAKEVKEKALKELREELLKAGVDDYEVTVVVTDIKKL